MNLETLIIFERTLIALGLTIERRLPWPDSDTYEYRISHPEHPDLHYSQLVNSLEWESFKAPDLIALLLALRIKDRFIDKSRYLSSS